MAIFIAGADIVSVPQINMFGFVGSHCYASRGVLILPRGNPTAKPVSFNNEKM